MKNWFVDNLEHIEMKSNLESKTRKDWLIRIAYNLNFSFHTGLRELAMNLVLCMNLAGITWVLPSLELPFSLSLREPLNFRRMVLALDGESLGLDSCSRMLRSISSILDPGMIPSMQYGSLNPVIGKERKVPMINLNQPSKATTWSVVLQFLLQYSLMNRKKIHIYQHFDASCSVSFYNQLMTICLWFR